MGDLMNRPISKVIDKDYYISFQKMVLNIALRFMNIDEDGYNDQVNFLLSEMGSFFNVDRTYLFTINERHKTMTYSHEWCNKGIKPEILTINQIPLTTFPWWLDQLEKNNLVYIEDPSQMPKAAKAEQDQLLRQNIKSLISVPVLIEDKIVAFIGIDSVKNYKVWPVEKINLLHTMAEIIANGINTIN